MKIAICGGTFDPFHRGHLEPVLRARAAMGWDRILYVPAHRQPFKVSRNSASGYHRFAMAVLATENRDGVSVSPIELERAGVSFTVDTLGAIREQQKADDTIDWIIGDDNLPKLHEWKSLDTIFSMANFAVLARTDAAVPAEFQSLVRTAGERGTHGAIVFVHNSAVPVSSTEIRERVRKGAPIDAFVDPRVAHYIHHYGLYKGTA